MSSELVSIDNISFYLFTIGWDPQYLEFLECLYNMDQSGHKVIHQLGSFTTYQ